MKRILANRTDSNGYLETANYVTYYLQPDKRIVVGFEYNQWWYSCHIGVIYYLFDFLEVSEAFNPS